jgi:hypothetical protein
VAWLKRFGFPRGAVVQPYLTPRFAMSGRKASGRRNWGGSWPNAQLVGSFGAILRGFVVDLESLGFGTEDGFRYGGRERLSAPVI